MFNHSFTMKPLDIAGLCLFSLVGMSLGLGQRNTITLAPTADALQLAGAGINGQILVSANDWFGVQKAAHGLAEDFGRVTGTNLTVAAEGTDEKAAVYTYQPLTSYANFTLGPPVNITGPAYTGDASSPNTVIVAGTVGSSYVIDSLVSSSKINVSAISGLWESFTMALVDSPLPGVSKALVIAGSDPRGTIFGIYDLSEQIGVSPWYFWADVPARKTEQIWATDGATVQGPPSVKYRGLFINDEQPSLTNWINENYAPGKYGPGFNHVFYSHVFELLLRLKANYLWPAQWASMFNVDDYENQPLADAFGIVMGTSHTEPMMRATNEWDNFGTGSWEWDTNNASLYPFFTYGAERAKPYVKNSLFTVAMRGSGDTAIDLTQSEAITVLEKVVAAQQQILTDVFGNQSTVPQMWCLYKEVQGYYEAGMSVRDDVTLLWADDNFGNIRRLPLANETERVGGAGVYYHFDYVGDPRDYKWINTIRLEKTWEQMHLAFERQADRIWIVNVGDLKTLEIPINHFLDMAYDIGQFGPNSTASWLEMWASREFGSAAGPQIGSVVDTYGKLAARRKYELIDPTVYSIINYNEADSVLQEWSNLATDAQALYDGLDAAAQPAFFQLVLQPVLSGKIVNQIHIGAAKNQLYVEQKRTSANIVAQDVLKDFAQDHNLTSTYHSLLDGKWNHMLDQPHLGYDYWQQPMRNAIPKISWVQEMETSLGGDLGISVEGSNATVPGDDMYHTLSSNTLTLPPMDPYGPATRYIEIFSRGTTGCSWAANASLPFITLTPSSGHTGGPNGTDTRILISIDWPSAPTAPTSTAANILFNSTCNWGNTSPPTIILPINTTQIPANFTNGFVESDGHISIEASHFSTSTSTINNITYLTIPNYGRTHSGITLWPVLAPSQQPAGTGPVLTYNIHTFTPSTLANITLLISPSLNQNGPLRPLKYAIAIDDEVPQTVQFVANTTNGELPAGWEQAVADGVWGGSSGNGTTTRHWIGAGSHVLRLWAVETGVVFQRVLVDLGGVRGSYLGPPESFWVGGG